MTVFHPVKLLRFSQGQNVTSFFSSRGNGAQVSVRTNYRLDDMCGIEFSSWIRVLRENGDNVTLTYI